MSEIANVTQLQDIAQNGAKILEVNSSRAEKAVSVGKDILRSIEEAGGMTPELDERANKFLVNCRSAKNEMETQRKPITSFFDTIRKLYTEAESKVDVSKSDSIPSKIQIKRNEYVAKLKREEEARKAEQQRKIDHDNELIEIKAEIEKQLSAYTQLHILERKQKLQDGFNSITLENFKEKSDKLKSLIPVYKLEHLQAFSPTIYPKYCTADEVQQVRIDFMKSQDFNLIAAVIQGELLNFKKELTDKLPSLKNQLEELAKADEESRARMAKEKEDRERKEKEDLKRKADEAAKKKEEEIEMQKTSAQTEAMMDNLTLSNDGNAPETRSGYSIVILHPGAAMEIMNFWFQKEGMNMSIPDIEKKSIGQMKTFCQNYAHKHGEMIQSKFLKYEPVYKAVNRK